MQTERRFYPPTESDIPMHGWKPYSEMHRERIRAHEKHDKRDGSMERKHWTHSIWLPVVTEEVGEVARVLCDNELGITSGKDKLREELVQVGAMVAAWIDAIDADGTGSGEPSKCPTCGSDDPARCYWPDDMPRCTDTFHSGEPEGP